ncbi:MAG: polysaccharide deacetylase family protein [Firmicutes bacterium]|nr:polysaccharide deacetylase family protein [Bacillota bacterium]
MPVFVGILAILALALNLLPPGLLDLPGFQWAQRWSGADPRIVRWVNTEVKAVALTFDDGPDPVYTPDLLELLSARKVKATFFLIGKMVDARPDLARLLVLQGHELGNHSYNHPPMAHLSREEVDFQLQEASKIIEKATGMRPRYFRPPLNSHNDQLVSAVVSGGMTFIHWSVDSRDWESNSVDGIAGRVLTHAQPGDIILFHDHGGDRSVTIKAVEKVIDGLSARGYVFVTIGELLKIGRPASVAGPEERRLWRTRSSREQRERSTDREVWSPGGRD